ncbi:peptide ABC transporter substrate-binding protein [Lactobacillus equicursoris]|uniref:peptide ABC transporter substrate-binding protein n=1 Tax=Lactobacillus equicursoris TaxID=420645 RepID=UPI002432E8BB|nr:peptide ABC transporter substrate-binding protein [Lactobacillus equicursoris]MDD6385755.1 peptide ABC transporter substrate-binding protein [Lactobacillus equicursoris]
MKISKIFMGAGVVLAAASLSACGSSKASSSTKQVLNWTTSAEIPTMDLSKATDSVSFTQISNTFEGLYRFTSASKLEPALATSEKISKDGKTYTFTLRKGTKWSNGDTVTAKDFVYSWRRTVNPKTESEYSYLFSGIKNADKIVAGKKKASTLGIKAVGKYKLVVILERRIPYFNKLMGFGVFFPQNERAVKKYGSKYGTASKYMVYNGPYVQKGWTGSNLSWKMVKNKTYWDQKHVKLSQINWSVQKSTNTSYNLYQSKKLDATSLDSSQIKQLKKAKGFTTLAQGATYYMEFGQGTKGNKYVKNANIRKALSLAIDRKGLVSTVDGGASQPASTITAKDLTTVNGKDYIDTVSSSAKSLYPASANKKLARKYLEKGLKELGVSKIKLTLTSSDTDSAKATAEALQSNIESALPEVKIEVSSVPFKTLLSRLGAHNFQLGLIDWIADFADPISFLDLFTTGNSQNDGQWSNTTYDKLIADSKTTSSDAKRWKDLASAEDVLLNDTGVCPLYYSTTVMLVRPSVKKAVNVRGSWDFKETYIK